MSEHRTRYNLKEFLDYFGLKLRDTRSWHVSDIEGFDMKTEEDSKDGVMNFFQTREKKKRKNSVFGTYTLMISTGIKIFLILEGHKTFVWMFMFSS